MSAGTRLDRLFLLLDTGSTPVIRKSAAAQLGEVQRLHPHELNNLLTKVHGYLSSTSWETRIAAGQAVEAIVRNVPQWTPPGHTDNEVSEAHLVCGRLQLAQVDIYRVLTHGASLLASEGSEFDFEEKVFGRDQREVLAKQKQLLNKRLGLDVAPGLGLASDDLFYEEDLIVKSEDDSTANQQTSVRDILQQHMPPNSVLSARERNKAKRKAKLLSRQTSRDAEQKNGEKSEEDPPCAKLRKKAASCVVSQPDEDKVMIDNIPDNTLNMEEIEEWPFETFCQLLMNDLFNCAWEKRHGAATGLREVIKLHGKGSGKTVDIPQNKMNDVNQLWLEDFALRLICVLALDRFGDFVSDEVVAPVRETCAQTLGVALHHMSLTRVEMVVQVLLQLLQQSQWEVRHGGLLGLKYLLAVRQDVSSHLLSFVLRAVFEGLQDENDDVRAIGAAALLPVTDVLVQSHTDQMPGIIDCLWHTLLDLDDLTSSTNSLMTLLSVLLSHPSIDLNSTCSRSLSQYVPRLWPFMRHTISSVRKAALETLYTLLSRHQDDTAVWALPILQDMLRHIYQRSLLEEKEVILDVVYKTWCAVLQKCPVDHLISASSPWLGTWLCLMMQPSRIAFDQTFIIEAKHAVKELTPCRGRPFMLSHHSVPDRTEHKEYIAGFSSLNDKQANRDLRVVRARQTAARLLGALCASVSKPVPGLAQLQESSCEALGKLLIFHLNTKSAVQRYAVALVVMGWATSQQPCSCPEMVQSKLQECLVEALYFDEIAISFARMQTDCQDFIASLKQQGVAMDNFFPPGCVLTLEQAQALLTSIFDSVKSKLRAKQQQVFEERRQSLLTTVNQTHYDQMLLNTRVQASLAGALVMLHRLPQKLNPIIRPLMEALKKEENPDLQLNAAKTLAKLMDLCLGRTPSPNAKVIKNLCTMLCSDPSYTPAIGREHLVGIQSVDQSSTESGCDKCSGILTLTAQQKTPETGRGRKAAWKKSIAPSVDVSLESILSEKDESKKQLLVQRRGATLALTKLTKYFGSRLSQDLNSLWQVLLQPGLTSDSSTTSESNAESSEHLDQKAEQLVTSLQVFEVVGPAVCSSLHPELLKGLPELCECLGHPYTAVRHMASRCIGMLTKISTVEAMNVVLDDLLTRLGASDSETKRQGAAEAIANILEQLGIEVASYIVLLIVPILGRMSDQNDPVRLMATHCFATLIKIMPLEEGIPDPPAMKSSLMEERERQRRFLEQLRDGSKVEPYKIPVPIKAELRKYQQDGVNWLAFLNKYHLHGILCDDMGLGKTLQSICIMAGDHHLRAEQYRETKQADCAPLPSLVVCPPTLTGHWVYEVEKFISREYLDPLHYTGPPAERQRLQKKVKHHNLIVASYDVVRNDIDFFGSIHWNYCILDEGHIIRNSKTKLSRSIRQLGCNHRLILSGTPIQNNVLELWSLFDFLIPGFLGTEKQFQVRYGKPIVQSRDAKSSSKDQEAGALAMESLHRQVLPFLLRRLKEDVLQDLPPKIIQDLYCDLSSLQIQIYEDFAKSRARQAVDDSVQVGEEEKPATIPGTHHIFQALQYLRKVCNHPALVLKPNHPEYQRITAQLKAQGTSLSDLQYAPKLTALKQLLLDCGIGCNNTDTADNPVVNQHRVLLFCQLKSMLDIVEHDLLKCHMPDVSYLRLDGSIPAGNRHAIVNRFNNDPSIDILLLTTHVGGLGLNLTGADTVVFVEHDWNPMKDLQAMDRAHRIGQKKVVNVYRLVTRGTLEEKIMGLQKFKLNIANSVISQENSSLASMGTDQLLDLFSLDDKKTGPSTNPASESAAETKHNMKSIMENLEELWDEKQYETEYDLGNFMKSLAKT